MNLLRAPVARPVMARDVAGAPWRWPEAALGAWSTAHASAWLQCSTVAKT